MKKIYALSLIGFISFLATAQTTTGGMKWKSVIGIDYIYSGEINNGKPHGKGVAKAVNGTVKIFGDFKNGLIEGNAFAFYNNGKIAIAKWKKGYANGPGVAIEKDGSLYYGTYVNGYMENKTIKIFNNNKIVIDHLKGSMSNGRAIVIEESGTIISDIVYENDLANGPGFQYEVDGKKKYEGFWENGKWLRAATTNHPSFIRSYNFGGMKTDKQIIMYSNLVNQSPRDTCFAYDIPSGYRYFGYFENGNMIRGIRIIGKSEYSIGEFDAGGKKQGLFAEFKNKQYLCFGNYKDNELNGEAMYVSFSPGDTTVYDGEFKNGRFSGIGSKLDSKNIIYKGLFQNGTLTEGQKIICKVDALATNEAALPIGQKINLNPKDACTALNFLLKEFDNNFKNITDNKEFVSENKEENPFFDEYKALQSPYHFPGALVNKIVKAYKQNNFYFGLAISDNYSYIKNKYNALCTQLKACNITTLQKGKIMKLSGKAKILKTGDEAITILYIPPYSGKSKTPKIVVSLEKFEKYQLTVSITSYQEIE